MLIENEFIRKLTEIVEAHIGDSDFGVDQLAREAGLSYSSLRRKVGRVTGKPANQFIREIRLRKAHELLQEGKVNVAEAAYLTGFNTPSYFNTSFHDFFGYPPGEIRKIKESNGLNGTAKLNGNPLDQEPTDVPTSPVESKMKAKSVRRVKLLFVQMAVFGVMAIIGSMLLAQRNQNLREERSISILPFENLNQNSQYDYFSDLLRSSLQNKLGSVKSLTRRPLIERKAVADLPSSPLQRGRALKSNYLITANLAYGEDSLEMIMHVTGIRENRDVWSFDTVALMEDLFRMQSDITKRIASALDVVLSPDEIREIEVPPPAGQIEAISYLQRGSYYLHEVATAHAHDQAIYYYQKAIKTDSTLVRAYVRLALCQLEKYWFYLDRSPEILIECKKNLDKALELDPDNPGTHVVMGDYYYRGSLEYDKALEKFDQANRIDPDYPADFKRACVYQRMGNQKEAIDHFHKYAKVYPEAGIAINHLGIAYQFIKDYPNAILYYNRNIDLKPQWCEPYFNLAYVFLNSDGSVARASDILREGLLVNREFSEDSLFLEARIVVAICARNYEEALELIAQKPAVMLENQWYCRPMSLYEGQVYRLMGRENAARVCFDRARDTLEARLRRSPFDQRIHSALGIACAGLGDVDGALANARKAMELLPHSKEAMRGIVLIEDYALVCVMLHRHDQALEQLRFALAQPGYLSANLLRLDPRWEPLRAKPEFLRMIGI